MSFSSNTEAATRMACILALLLPVVFPVYGAVEIEVITTRQSNDETQQFIHHIIRDGPNASTLIRSLDSETFPDKSRLVTLRDREQVFFVNPEGTKCVSWDAGDFSVTLGRTLLKMTDQFDAIVSDPVFVRLYETPSEPILGYPVTETRWQLDADVTVTLLFKDFNWHVTRVITLWQTDIENFSERPSLIKPKWLKTGFPQLDDLVLSSVSPRSRFALKSEIVQSIDAPIGAPPKLTVSYEVRSLRELDQPLPADFFELPECQALSKDQLKSQATELMWLLYGKQIR
jgi:hypothetical protein